MRLPTHLKDSKSLRNLPVFLSFLRGYRAAWAIAILGMLAQILMQLPMPLLTGYVIDHVILRGDGRALNGIAALLVSLTLLYLALGYGTSLLTLRLAKSITARLRLTLFRRAQILPISYLSSRGTGYIMSRISDDPVHLNGLVKTSLSVVYQVLTFAVGVVAVFMLNVRLAALSLLVIPVFALSYTMLQGQLAELDDRRKEQNALISRCLKESLDALPTTKLYALHSRQALRFFRALRREIGLAIKSHRYEYAISGASGFFAAMGPLLVVWYGGHEVIAGRLTIGKLVAFSALLAFLYGPTKSIVDSRVCLLKAAVSLKRIHELLQEETDERRGIGRKSDLFPRTFGIEFQHVSFTYDGSQSGLRDLDFSIPHNSTMAIIGPTGAGKSTLVRLIPLLHPPTDGTIRIGGVDNRKLSTRTLRQHVGVVWQDPFIFADTVYENIRIGKHTASEEDVVRAAKLAGAYEFVTALERGFDTEISEAGSSLSGGQKQLICLARVILCDPPILILDEPTSAVDSDTERLMLNSLTEFMRDRTTILISHRVSTLFHVERILVLEQGTIAASGTHAELLARNEFYGSIVSVQGKPAVETPRWKGDWQCGQRAPSLS